MTIQAIKPIDDTVVHLIFNAFGDDEQTYSFSRKSFEILAENMKQMAGQDHGQQVWEFDLSQSKLPPNDEPEGEENADV